MDYKSKYLEYKNKYKQIEKLIKGGGTPKKKYNPTVIDATIREQQQRKKSEESDASKIINNINNHSNKHTVTQKSGIGMKNFQTLKYDLRNTVNTFFETEDEINFLKKNVITDSIFNTHVNGEYVMNSSIMIWIADNIKSEDEKKTFLNKYMKIKIIIILNKINNEKEIDIKDKTIVEILSFINNDNIYKVELSLLIEIIEKLISFIDNKTVEYNKSTVLEELETDKTYFQEIIVSETIANKVSETIAENRDEDETIAKKADEETERKKALERKKIGKQLAMKKKSAKEAGKKKLAKEIAKEIVLNIKENDKRIQTKGKTGLSNMQENVNVAGTEAMATNEAGIKKDNIIKEKEAEKLVDEIAKEIVKNIKKETDKKTIQKKGKEDWKKKDNIIKEKEAEKLVKEIATHIIKNIKEESYKKRIQTKGKTGWSNMLENVKAVGTVTTAAKEAGIKKKSRITEKGEKGWEKMRKSVDASGTVTMAAKEAGERKLVEDIVTTIENKIKYIAEIKQLLIFLNDLFKEKNIKDDFYLKLSLLLINYIESLKQKNTTLISNFKNDINVYEEFKNDINVYEKEKKTTNIKFFKIEKPPDNNTTEEIYNKMKEDLKNYREKLKKIQEKK